MATLPLESSHKEQPSVIHLLWANLPFSLRCVQCMVTNILQDQQSIHPFVNTHKAAVIIKYTKYKEKYTVEKFKKK